MRTYQGISVSSGMVVGHVSRIFRDRSDRSTSGQGVERELELLEAAIGVAQKEMEKLANRAAESEKAIFLFQSMMLEDAGFMNEVKAYINGGMTAAASMERVGQRYADKMRAMVDNPYLQLRSVDILDVCQRVVNVLDDRPREHLDLDHPVIIASDMIMPSDLFSAPAGMILGIVTSEGSPQSHASILARALNIPSVIQVGRDFLEDCDGHVLALDATTGECVLDPDMKMRQQFVSRLCQEQRMNEQLSVLRALPNRTKDGRSFEILANCFGPEDIDSAIQNGAYGVGLLRSGYLMLRGGQPDEQEQYFFYTSCVAAAQGSPITVRTLDFGSDKTLETATKGLTSSALGLRGIRSSLLHPRLFEAQLCALLRAGARGRIRVMFPMVTDVADWDAAMKIVERCKRNLRIRGVPFDEDMKFGVMLSIPAACLTAEEFVEHGCDFFTIGINDLVQYTHAADRTLSSLESYYHPTSNAIKKLMKMVLNAATEGGIPVNVCGLSVGNPATALEYFRLGFRSFSMSPQNMLKVKKEFLNETTELEVS